MYPTIHSLPEVERPEIKERTLRFDDHTDVTAFGISLEEASYRVPANLPLRPEGLALQTPRYPHDIPQPSPHAQFFHLQWSVWLAPSVALLLLLVSVGLIAFRVQSLWLMVPTVLVCAGFVWSCWDLAQHRLWIDDAGIGFGRRERPLHYMSWSMLAGIDQRRCLGGQVLVLMHQHHADQRIEIAHLAHIGQIKRLIWSHQQRLATSSASLAK